MPSPDKCITISDQIRPTFIRNAEKHVCTDITVPRHNWVVESWGYSLILDLLKIKRRLPTPDNVNDKTVYVFSRIIPVIGIDYDKWCGKYYGIGAVKLMHTQFCMMKESYRSHATSYRHRDGRAEKTIRGMLESSRRMPTHGIATYRYR